jgi:serine/threonine protein kinase
MADSQGDLLLGHMCVGAGLISRAQLDDALAAVRASGGSTTLREVLVSKGWVSAETLDRATEASIVADGPTGTIAVPATRAMIGPAPTAATIGPPPTAPTMPAARPPAPTPPTIYPGSPSQAATEGIPRSQAPTQAASSVAAAAETPPEVVEAAKVPKNQFGKYILLKQLGAGGMAVVYKAWDPYLHQYVALKFIKTQDLDHEGEAGEKQLQAFLAEARLAVKLNHPNIARVFELGQVGDRYFMAQFYIDGPSLHEVIHGTRSKSEDTLFYGDPRRFLKIMRDIADAMSYAHSLSIIHRDLKPANVMLDTSGRAYVVDFGLAKEMKVGQTSMSGVVKGTPKYMAPEQAEGRARDMDARTDIWALGVILYEMLTGRAPFEHENLHKLLTMVVNDDPPWPRHVVNDRTAKLKSGSGGAVSVPHELEIIAMKCLQKDARHRYADAKELVADLERASRGEEISIPEHSLRWAMGRGARLLRRYRAAMVFAVLLLAGVAALLAFGRGRGPDLAGLIRKGDEAVAARRWDELPAIEATLAVHAPEHPKLAEFRAARAAASGGVEKRREEAVRLRDAFLAAPSDATLVPYAAFLRTVEPVLAPAARQGLREWWTSTVSSRTVEADSLHGGGAPRREWLAAETRARAEKLKADLEFAGRAWLERSVLDLPETDLARPLGRVKELLDWKGTFSLAADVRPWASVRVWAGGKELTRDVSRQENLTPLLQSGLPVAELRIELARGAAKSELLVPAAKLRDGSVLRVWGTIEKLEHVIE